MTILKLILNGSENAKTASQLAQEYSLIAGREIKIQEVRKEIKANRDMGIIWNNKGSYYETNKDNIESFIKKRVIPSMYGYNKGMNIIGDKLGRPINLNIG